jgi:ribosomal protein L12E/L44/L45/RPP1/RPP2
MPALSSSPIDPVLLQLAMAAETDQLSSAGPRAALRRVPDPRKRRGLRHQISVILMIAGCAVMAGARSFAAIGEWAGYASDQLLAVLVVGVAPSESTIRRTLQRLDGDSLDAAIGAWAAQSTQPPAGARRALAGDGKTPRGSGSDTAEPRHLLAAIDGADARRRRRSAPHRPDQRHGQPLTCPYQRLMIRAEDHQGATKIVNLALDHQGDGALDR